MIQEKLEIERSFIFLNYIFKLTKKNKNQPVEPYLGCYMWESHPSRGRLILTGKSAYFSSLSKSEQHECTHPTLNKFDVKGGCAPCTLST